MNLVVNRIFQHLLPRAAHIGIFVQLIDEVSERKYFLMVIFQHGSAHKTYRVLPDIVLADKLVVFAAVNDGKRAFGEVVSRVDAVCIFAVQPSGAFGRVEDAECVELRRFVGKGGRDRYASVAQFIRKIFAKIKLPAVGVLKIIGQGKTVACLGRNQASEELRGK